MKTSTWQCGTPRASCSGGSDIVLAFTHSLLSGGIFMFLSTQGLGNNGAGDLNLTYILIICQRQQHLLRGSHSFGASSRPSCCLPTSTGLCSCAHGRGKAEPTAKISNLNNKKRNMESIRYIKVISSQNQFSYSSSKQLGTHLPLPHMRRQPLENYYPHFGRLNHLCLLLTALTVPSIDVYKM